MKVSSSATIEKGWVVVVAKCPVCSEEFSAGDPNFFGASTFAHQALFNHLRMEHSWSETKEPESETKAAKTETKALEAATKEAEAATKDAGRDQFGSGVKAMTRSCSSALKLVRDGKWTLEVFEKWLQLCLSADGQEAKEFLNQQFGEPSSPS